MFKTLKKTPLEKGLSSLATTVVLMFWSRDENQQTGKNCNNSICNISFQYQTCFHRIIESIISRVFFFTLFSALQEKENIAAVKVVLAAGRNQKQNIKNYAAVFVHSCH